MVMVVGERVTARGVVQESPATGRGQQQEEGQAEQYQTRRSPVCPNADNLFLLVDVEGIKKNCSNNAVAIGSSKRPYNSSSRSRTGGRRKKIGGGTRK